MADLHARGLPSLCLTVPLCVGTHRRAKDARVKRVPASLISTNKSVVTYDRHVGTPPNAWLQGSDGTLLAWTTGHVRCRLALSPVFATTAGARLLVSLFTLLDENGVA